MKSNDIIILINIFLLEVSDNQTELTINITVQSMLPVLNTNLIWLYSLFDQRFHILGLYTKNWAKIKKYMELIIIT